MKSLSDADQTADLVVAVRRTQHRLLSEYKGYTGADVIRMLEFLGQKLLRIMKEREDERDPERGKVGMHRS
jgi:hypothetical protein